MAIELCFMAIENKGKMGNQRMSIELCFMAIERKNEKSKNVTIKTITLSMLYGNRTMLYGNRKEKMRNQRMLQSRQ